MSEARSNHLRSGTQPDVSGGEGIPWPLKAGQLVQDDNRPVIWPWISLAETGKLTDVEDSRPIPWPWAKRDQLLKGALSDLMGRKLRVSSSPVAQDIEPGRLTILTDSNGRITDLYVDPGRESS